MSFVGTRPEVTKYVKKYTKEMRATLLLPAGITSEASIQYKDEAELLDAADDVDKQKIEHIYENPNEIINLKKSCINKAEDYLPHVAIKVLLDEL